MGERRFFPTLFMEFKNFLLQHKHQLGPIGKFSNFALQDKNYPFQGNFVEQLKYLEESNAPLSALEAFTDTYKEYNKRVPWPR